MKKLINIFFIVILIYMNTYARPVWDQDPDSRTYRATANIAVENLAGNGVPNISGTFHFKMSFDTDGDGVEDNYQLESASFSTDQQGYAFVELFITVPSDWYNGWKNVYVSDISGQINGVDISVVESNDTQSNYYFNIYPSYVVIEDNDQNGIHDPFEMQLAQKFCPTYILNSATDFIRPEPVQYLGVEKQDLRFFVYNIDGQEIGHYYLPEQSQFNPPISDDWQPWMANLNSSYDFVTYNAYDYIGCPPYCAGGWYFLRFHFDYAGDCNSESCWSNFYSNERINNNYPNTIYTHLFIYNSYIVIQYWSFYPYNDFVNNHEGDWEHINVWVSKDTPENSSLYKIEYYFHHKYLDRNPNEIEIIDQTHPVVYVGGQNSTDPGVHSGANFPEAKFWEAVGAVNFDERVLGNGPTISYSSFIDSEPDDEYGIVILPDIEDIDFIGNPEMSWFGTKIPWGYISSDSYGQWIEFFGKECGNTPPSGPAYRAGWNKVSGDGYDLYVYEE